MDNQEFYSKRPNLTHLTQSKFVEANENHIALEETPELPIIICSNYYKKACLNIPKLVEIAEILYDKTSSKPDGMIHLLVKNLLDDLRRE